MAERSRKPEEKQQKPIKVNELQLSFLFQFFPPSQYTSLNLELFFLQRHCNQIISSLPPQQKRKVFFFFSSFLSTKACGYILRMFLVDLSLGLQPWSHHPLKSGKLPGCHKFCSPVSSHKLRVGPTEVNWRQEAGVQLQNLILEIETPPMVFGRLSLEREALALPLKRLKQFIYLLINLARDMVAVNALGIKFRERFLSLTYSTSRTTHSVTPALINANDNETSSCSYLISVAHRTSTKLNVNEMYFMSMFFHSVFWRSITFKYIIPF